MKTIESTEPRAHTENIRGEFRELIQHLRNDVQKVDEPKARALFETAAEVISGLDRHFSITKKSAKQPGSKRISIRR